MSYWKDSPDDQDLPPISEALALRIKSEPADSVLAFSNQDAFLSFVTAQGFTRTPKSPVFSYENEETLLAIGEHGRRPFSSGLPENQSLIEAPLQFYVKRNANVTEALVLKVHSLLYNVESLRSDEGITFDLTSDRVFTPAIAREIKERGKAATAWSNARDKYLANISYETAHKSDYAAPFSADLELMLGASFSRSPLKVKGALYEALEKTPSLPLKDLLAQNFEQPLKISIRCQLPRSAVWDEKAEVAAAYDTARTGTKDKGVIEYIQRITAASYADAYRAALAMADALDGITAYNFSQVTLIGNIFHVQFVKPER